MHILQVLEIAKKFFFGLVALEDELVKVLSELVIVILEFAEGVPQRSEGLDLLGEGFDDLWGVACHISKWKIKYNAIDIL